MSANIVHPKINRNTDRVGALWAAVEPPRAPEAEVSVLGAMLDNEEAAARAVERLDAWMFAERRHQQIFRAMRRILERGSAIDPVTVAEDLTVAGELEDVGGVVYLGELLAAVPTAANLTFHADIVADRAERRREIEAAQQIARDAADGSLELAEVRSRRARRFAELDRAARVGRPSRLISDLELESRPAPEELIDGLMPVGGLVVAYGPPGSGKTFVVLDWAFSVGTGFRWLGREVRPGPVVYVAAEGSSGLSARVRAWKEHRGYVGSAGVHFLTEPVDLMDPAEVDRFLGELQDLEEAPALVVFDTLARCMVAGDENNTADMSAFIAGADRVRRETGAAVCLVHHSRKDSDLERGSTALRGAADTMIAIREDDDAIVVACEKQKDSPPFDKIVVELEKVGESCVVIPATGTWQGGGRDLTDLDREALVILSQIDVGGGVSLSAWRDSGQFKERSIYRARKRLVDNGFVEMVGEGRGARHSLTEKGAGVISATLPHSATTLPGTVPTTLPDTGPPSLEGARSGRQGRHPADLLEAGS